MLEPGTPYYPVLRRGEVDQPQTVVRSRRVKAELPDSRVKDTFLPDLRVKIPEDNLDVVGQAFAVQVPEFRV